MFRKDRALESIGGYAYGIAPQPRTPDVDTINVRERGGNYYSEVTGIVPRPEPVATKPRIFDFEQEMPNTAPVHVESLDFSVGVDAQTVQNVHEHLTQRS